MEVKVAGYIIDLKPGNTLSYNGSAYVVNDHKVGRWLDRHHPSISNKIAKKMIKLGILKSLGMSNGNLGIEVELYEVTGLIETVNPEEWKRKKRVK